jgi:hypothetical protein
LFNSIQSLFHSSHVRIHFENWRANACLQFIFLSLLRDLKKKDLDNDIPGSKESAETCSAAANSKEQAGMDIVFQAELERHLDRKEPPDQNMNKAHALIFSQCCNKTMQNRIEEHPDFETLI